MGHRAPGPAVPAALLAALLLGSPLAAADPVFGNAGAIASAALGAAGTVGDAGVRGAALLAQAAGGLAGPVGDNALAAVGQATGGLAGSGASRLFVAAGHGSATAQLTNTGGSCTGMRVQVEQHPVVSNEPTMYVNLLGGEGSPFFFCATGWRFGFTAHEVQGDPERGWVAHRESIDAIIDMTLGPAGPDGQRPMWVRQVTYPSGIGDVMTFTGTVTRVV